MAPQSIMHDCASEARRALRRWHEGWLTASAFAGPARYVIDDDTGRLTLFAEPQALEQEAPALLIPEESEPELELLLDLQRQPPEVAHRDRWRAYHAAYEPERAGEWASAIAETVRLCITPGPEVFDGPDVCQPNPLRQHLTGLLREPNRRRDDLARAVRARIGEASVAPVAVGADPWGLDVRARFGVIRLEFDTEAGDPDAAAAAIEALLGG
jgi:hypothetical protein